MQKLLSLVVTLATFISALLGIHNTEDVGGFNKKDWMSRIDGSKYIITKKTTVKKIHEIAKEIYAIDADAFFAGIAE